MIKYNHDLEWKVGHIALSVEQDGGMKICDIRGWGFLTGTGHACGLSAEEAKKIQVKHANLIAAAPDMFREIKEFLEACYDAGGCNMVTSGLEKALSKAKGMSCPE